MFDKIFRQLFFRRKIDKLPVFAELWIFGRNRQMRLEKLPPKFYFQLSTTFGGGVKEIVSIFAPDFRPKMISRLLVFWLEDTCVPDDKNSAAWWIVASSGAAG